MVQAYVEPPPARLPRPRRELRAFAKVRPGPGETVVARLVLPPRAFAYWDPGSTETAYLDARRGDSVLVPGDTGPVPRAEAGWYAEDGPHLVHLARSVADVVATVEVAVTCSSTDPGRLE